MTEEVPPQTSVALRDSVVGRLLALLVCGGLIWLVFARANDGVARNTAEVAEPGGFLASPAAQPDPSLDAADGARTPSGSSPVAWRADATVPGTDTGTAEPAEFECLAVQKRADAVRRLAVVINRPGEVPVAQLRVLHQYASEFAEAVTPHPHGVYAEGCLAIESPLASVAATLRDHAAFYVAAGQAGLGREVAEMARDLEAYSWTGGDP
jgi:hypothetical protein